jgi:SNF2 family DNA or RNA helicase
MEVTPVKSRRKDKSNGPTPTRVKNLKQSPSNVVTPPHKKVIHVKSSEKKTRGRKKTATPISSKSLRRKVLQRNSQTTITYEDEDEEQEKDVEKSLIFDEENEKPSTPIKEPTIHEKTNDSILTRCEAETNWYQSETCAYYLDGKLESAPTESSVPSKSLRVPLSTYNKMMPHQRVGVHFLYDHFNNEESSGAILADDMGLGKTMQTAIFLESVFTKDVPFRGLIVAPVAVICNWQKELASWASTRTFLYLLINNNSAYTDVL